MTEELKPCPFCGSAAAMDQFEAEPWGGLLTVIGCSSSGCPISPTTDEVPAEIAIAAWNARAEADGQRIAELEAALREMFEVVCGETGFAQAVRAESGLAYPWPALDLAEAKARAALGDKTDD